MSIRSARWFFFLVLAAIVLLVLGVTFSAIDLWDRHFQSAPSTPIQDASPGSTIKITGTIGGTAGTVVMDGVYIHAAKSSHWRWTNYNFLLLVGNTTVSVNAGGIGSSVYGAPHLLTAEHEQYWAGDRVSVVGTVDTPTALSAEAVGTGPNAFQPPWEDPVAEGFDVGAAVSVTGVMVLLYHTSGRVKQRRLRVDSSTPFEYHPPVVPP